MANQTRKLIGSFVFVTAALVLVAILASAGVSWAAPGNQGTVPPPPPPPGGFPVTVPIGGGNVYMTTSDGRVTTYFPPSPFPPGTLASITSVPDCLPAPGVINVLGYCYNITVTLPDGTTVTTFTPPLTLFFLYSAEDLAKVGGNPNNFVIQYYNPATGAWSTQDLGPLTVDTTKNQVSVTVPHLTLFGLFGRVGVPLGQPGPAATPTRTPGGGGGGVDAGLFDAVLDGIKGLFNSP